MKTCSFCKRLLPLHKFYPRSVSCEGKPRHRCKQCINGIARCRWASDPKYKNKKAAKNRERYHADPKYRERMNKKSSEHGRRQRLANRELVLRHYGGEKPTCACCSQSFVWFLSIDHIDGGGNKHRRTLSGRVKFYTWLIRNNFPSGYQVLCMNCNWGKRMNGGVCPHKTIVSI